MQDNTLLKTSQFNYSVTDENGDVILCNFARGLSSFCRVIATDAAKLSALLQQKDLVYDQKNQLIVKLVEKGILVPKDFDEMLTVNSLYYETVMDSKHRIIVMPTEQCNFRCKYCYESYKKGKMSQEDQTALLKFIQQKMNETNKMHISWFGGEPLEALDVVCSIMSKVLCMAEKRNLQVLSDMTTNAFNLDPETFDKLYSLKIRTYQITLDGLEEQHNKQRVLENGEGTFRRIVENLLYVKNNYSRYRFASISIRVNISRDILNNLGEFISFYRNNFGNDRRFSLALTPINDMGGESVKTIKNQFVDMSEIYATINELDLYNDTSIQISNIMRAFSPKESLCYASKKNTYVVGSDLTIYKCTVHFEMDENKIGKILPNGTAIIDDNYHQQWYVNYQFRDSCKKCFMLPCCYGGGCPHKRCFVNRDTGMCVLTTWKRELKNAIRYISKRSLIETIKM